MTEAIRELNAGELQLVSGGGAIARIAGEAIKGLFAAAGTVAGEILGGPPGAIFGGILGVAAGSAIDDSLGLD